MALDYIKQINVFWLLDAEHLFNGNESRLYFYLLKLSNSLYWKNPLTNADGYTAATVGISINTLKTARNRLQQAGLIRFKPGGNGSRDKCIYELIEAAKILNKVSNSDTLSSESLTPYPQPNQRKADDINKQKPKETKPKDKGEASSPQSKTVEEKKLLLDKRATAFGLTLKSFEEEYTRPLLNEFYKYWIEPNQSLTKMRFEMERTWDTKRRLDHWRRMGDKFDHKKPTSESGNKADETFKKLLDNGGKH